MATVLRNLRNIIDEMVQDQVLNFDAQPMNGLIDEIHVLGDSYILTVDEGLDREARQTRKTSSTRSLSTRPTLLPMPPVWETASGART